MTTGRLPVAEGVTTFHDAPWAATAASEGSNASSGASGLRDAGIVLYASRHVLEQWARLRPHGGVLENRLTRSVRGATGGSSRWPEGTRRRARLRRRRRFARRRLPAQRSNTAGAEALARRPPS